MENWDVDNLMSVHNKHRGSAYGIKKGRFMYWDFFENVEYV